MLEGTHPWLTASPSVLSGKNDNKFTCFFISFHFSKKKEQKRFVQDLLVCNFISYFWDGPYSIVQGKRLDVFIFKYGKARPD